MFGIDGLAICAGASIGALLRWWLGMILNSVFPSLPLGTLAANVVGGFLMGIFMVLTKNHFFSEAMRLGIATGFLGGLTTFSTFSGEAMQLITHEEYLMSTALIIAHVGGSLLATFLGMYATLLVLGAKI